jgi:hypothetical protein
MAAPVRSKPAPAKTVDDEPEARGGRGRWLLGWVLVPGALLAALFLAGVHVGANHPDMWLSRLMAWIAR